MLYILGVSCIKCYSCSPCKDFRLDAILIECPKRTNHCLTEIYKSHDKDNSSEVTGKIL